MVFRDDREALGERVEALEKDLSDARKEVAFLKGGPEPNSPEASPFFGAPLRVELVRELPGEIVEETRELIVEELRRRFGRSGQVSIVGQSLSWSIEPTQAQPQRDLMFTVRSRHGRTVIHGSERNGQLAGGLFGGIFGSLGLAASTLIAIFVGRAFGPLLAVLGVLSALALLYFVTRAIYVGVARSRRGELHRALDAIADIAKDDLRVGASAKETSGGERTFVRVEPGVEAKETADGVEQPEGVASSAEDAAGRAGR
jgi:hypothetical protein